jgi:hypothetical protein
MYNHPVTRQEKTLVALMKWWAFLFAMAGTAFAVFPNQIVNLLNTLGFSIIGWRAPLLQPSGNSFWLVLAVTMMLMLVISAIKAQLDIVNNIFYVKLIIIAKLSSTIGFLIAFLLQDSSFAYLAGAATDGLIFIITLIAYRRAYVSRYIK